MNNQMSVLEYELKSVEYRSKLLKYIKQAGAGHTSGSLSCVDILNVLYNGVMHVCPENIHDSNRDRFIQSKGHSVEALYVVLADQGFFPESDLNALCQYHSPYVGHPTRKVNGIEQNTGALGHGLSVSAGMALAGKLDQRMYRVFTLLGDGELAEGSNWEAALIASHYKLDNLIAIVDYNGLQITDKTKNVCCTDPLEDKFTAFGWFVQKVDGHNIEELLTTFQRIPFESEKPSLIIAETIKGKGVDFMEHEIKWHHGVPDDEQYHQAQLQLNSVKQSLITDHFSGQQ